MSGPYLQWDASTPLQESPPGFKACAGYIGGYTPHVWDKTEWKRFPELKKLPIWVSGDAVDASYGAAQDGQNILDRLRVLGVPKKTAVVIDMETRVGIEYLTKLHRIIRDGGYYLWVYGSESTVFQNPPCDGYWVADYTGKMFQFKHKAVRGTQYASNETMDSSELKQWSYWFRMSRKWKL